MNYNPKPEWPHLVDTAQNTTLPLTSLFYQFNALMRLSADYKNIHDKSLLEIEKQKLTIILIIANLLKNKNKLIKSTNRDANEKPPLIKRVFGYMYAFIGPFFAGFGGFLGFRSILSIIMHIPNVPALIVALITGIFEGLLSFGKEESEIKKMIGAPIIKTKPIFHIYKSQLQAVMELSNDVLGHWTYHRITTADYIHFHHLIGAFHQDIINKHEYLQQTYKEGLGRKIIKWLVCGVDALLYIGSSFLLGKIIVGLLAAPLLTTPIGFAICAAIAVFSIGTYYFLKKQQIADVIDNIVGDPKSLKAEQAQFIHDPHGMAKYNKEMKAIISSKSKLHFKRNKVHYHANNNHFFNDSRLIKNFEYTIADSNHKITANHHTRFFHPNHAKSNESERHLKLAFLHE